VSHRVLHLQIILAHQTQRSCFRTTPTRRESVSPGWCWSHCVRLHQAKRYTLHLDSFYLSLKPLQQILAAYIDVSQPRHLRRSQLRETYGFKCECSLCTSTTPVTPDPRWAVTCPKNCGGLCALPDAEEPEGQADGSCCAPVLKTWQPSTNRWYATIANATTRAKRRRRHWTGCALAAKQLKRPRRSSGRVSTFGAVISFAADAISRPRTCAAVDEKFSSTPWLASSTKLSSNTCTAASARIAAHRFRRSGSRRQWRVPRRSDHRSVPRASRHAGRVS